MVDSVEEEVEHEEERTVGKPFLDVEDESMHDVFEDLGPSEQGQFAIVGP